MLLIDKDKLLEVVNEIADDDSIPNLEAIGMILNAIYEAPIHTNTTDWFGMVRWCDADLESALEEEDYPATENNISKLRHLCDHHSFEDVMIERGWEHLSDLILQNDGWDEYDE